MRILFLIFKVHILEIIFILDDGQSSVVLVVGLEPCVYLSEDSLVSSVKLLQTPGELIPVIFHLSYLFFVSEVRLGSKLQQTTAKSVAWPF